MTDTPLNDLPTFKIFRPSEWFVFAAAGRFEGSDHDLRDGFIHLCSPAQLPGVLERYFADTDAVVLAEVVPGPDALKWEANKPGGEAFPHLYAPMDGTMVRRNRRFVRRDGAFALSDWLFDHE